MSSCKQKLTRPRRNPKNVPVTVEACVWVVVLLKLFEKSESLLTEEEREDESDNVGWKAQHAGTMHSMRERKVRRNRTCRPQSTEVAVSIMCSTIGPLWLPKSIMVLILLVAK